MTNELNFKELYEVSLKSTLPIEVSGTKIEAGETIASFDRIQIANFQEIKSTASANGGWDNRAHIFWETTKEVKISFKEKKVRETPENQWFVVKNTHEPIVKEEIVAEVGRMMAFKRKRPLEQKEPFSVEEQRNI